VTGGSEYDLTLTHVKRAHNVFDDHCSSLPMYIKSVRKCKMSIQYHMYDHKSVASVRAAAYKWCSSDECTNNYKYHFVKTIIPSARPVLYMFNSRQRVQQSNLTNIHSAIVLNQTNQTPNLS